MTDVLQLKIAGIAGSLRKGSFNRAALTRFLAAFRDYVVRLKR